MKGGETPNRGQSGSARRRVVAQQSMNHMKKQMSQKDGTPKSRNQMQAYNTAQVPSMSSTMPGNRIKSSRASQNRGQPTVGGSQPRAITPKQNQKMYQSINVNKDPRGSSQNNKLMNNSQMNMNLNHRNNMMAGGQADYMLKNSMGKLGGQTQQLGGILSMTS